MKSTLLYTVVNYSTKDVLLFDLLLQSIHEYSPHIKDHADIMVITNHGFAEQIKKLDIVKTFGGVHFMFVPQDVLLVNARSKRLDIFDYPKLSEYKTCMFLDYDCVLQRDIVPLLTGNVTHLKSGVLYAYNENPNVQSHMQSFYGLQSYTEEQLRWFRQHNVHTFSDGVMWFKQTNAMKRHFAAIKRWMAEAGQTWQNITFFEQSFMNVYFNTRNKCNTRLLSGKVISRNIKTERLHLSNTAFDTQTIINHFCGVGYLDEKVLRIKRFRNAVRKFTKSMVTTSPQRP
jgi:hypothetical protein